MMTTYNISIDLDQRCQECNKSGTASGGLCLKCVSKAMTGKPMKSASGKEAARRIAERIGRGAT